MLDRYPLDTLHKHGLKTSKQKTCGREWLAAGL